MAQVSGGEARITMRVGPEKKALIERAAEARGLSVTDFMLSLALREAETALADRAVFALSEDAYCRFSEILERPARAKLEFQELFERNRKSKWKADRN
jgi:uncharacterized protein (DUF1778 family)